MIDLHRHRLPGLDDGAENLSISLTMARVVVVQAFRKPHVSSGRFRP
jgi:tyrosine-protein phosphatase YwqE